MREIKLRFWHIATKDMSPVDWTITELMAAGARTGHVLLPNEGVFLQYTGLNDKYGEEIYEGDILKLADDVIAEVYWDYCSWQLRDGDKTGGMLGNWEPDQIEIIGNKYSNPDLLENNQEGGQDNEGLSN